MENTGDNLIIFIRLNVFICLFCFYTSLQVFFKSYFLIFIMWHVVTVLKGIQDRYFDNQALITLHFHQQRGIFTDLMLVLVA